jgi:spermidine synthase
MKIGAMSSWYRWIEYAAFGHALEDRRFTFLPSLAAARRVLMPGEGDGRTLARLLALAPVANIDVVEVSPEMIGLAKRRTGNPSRVSFQCRDARDVTWPAAGYDAIVTHFFLDCFGEDDSRRLIRLLADALTPDGIWLISEFAIPRRGWRRLHAQVWIHTMYGFFRVTTGLRVQALAPIATLMQEAGLERVALEQQRAGLIVSEIWRRTKPSSSAGPRTSS